MANTSKDASAPVVSSPVAEAKSTFPNAERVVAIGASGRLRRVDMGGRQDVDRKLENKIKAASRKPMKFRLREEPVKVRTREVRGH